RQPLSDRRRTRAKVLAARSARCRQVLPAVAVTHWARPSCMAPCSVSTIRVETPASRRRAACCKAAVTRSAVPKPALARPSVRNTSSGCDGCFLRGVPSEITESGFLERPLIRGLVPLVPPDVEWRVRDKLCLADVPVLLGLQAQHGD